MIKKIPIDKVKPGMVVSKLDKHGINFNYYGTPIPDESVIEYLKNNSVEYVFIHSDEETEDKKRNSTEITQKKEKIAAPEEDIDFESLLDSFSYDIDQEQKSQIEDISTLEDIHSKATKEIAEILNKLKFALTLDIPSVRGILRDFVFLASQKPQTLANSIRLKQFDDYLSNHTINVCLLSLAIAGRLKMSRRDINNLGLAALLHDIGMTKVPDKVVNKAGKLTEHEFDKIKIHPNSSYEMAKRWDRSLSKSVLMGILQHHERIDGSGYPNKASGSDISLFAQIICVADVYDALTSNKNYREALSHMQVLKILYQESGVSLNKKIVTALISLVGVYPVSTILQMRSGKCAVVFDVNPHELDKPKVIIFSDEELNMITPYFEDLAKNNEKIRKIISPGEIDADPNNIITAFMATRMLD